MLSQTILNLLFTFLVPGLTHSSPTCDSATPTPAPLDYSLLELLNPSQGSEGPLHRLAAASPPCPTVPTPKQKGSISKLIQTHKNFGLLPKSCGQSQPSSHFFRVKIAGGKDAGLGSFPWMALIGYSLIGVGGSRGPVKYLCGGSLINENYILTAGHCLAEGSVPQGNVPVTIRLGEYNQSASTDCGTSSSDCAPPTEDIPIAETRVHEGFNRNGTNDNDIALIRLERPVKFGRFVSPVCLPRGGRKLNMTGMTLTVAGWGHTSATLRQPAEVLQSLDVPFETKYKCDKVYRDFLGRDVDEGRFCAGGVFGQDSCLGDSGGPLMFGEKITNETKTLSEVYQLGVVSMGPGNCDSSELPGLYTNVYHFMPWILDHIH